MTVILWIILITAFFAFFACIYRIDQLQKHRHDIKMKEYARSCRAEIEAAESDEEREIIFRTRAAMNDRHRNLDVRRP